MTTKPKTFKDFYESQGNIGASSPPFAAAMEIAAAGISASLIGAALKTGAMFPDASRDEFGRKVAEVAYSDEFITQFSNEIGTPLSSESEDQFVQRAKAAMTKLLRDKLS
jgi:hypothetical protein